LSVHDVLVAVMVTSDGRKRDEEDVPEGQQLRHLLDTVEGVTAARVDTDLRQTWVHGPIPGSSGTAVPGRRDAGVAHPADAGPTLRLTREALETGRRVTDAFSFHEPRGDR
jgi:hypothetical protein